MFGPILRESYEKSRTPKPLVLLSTRYESKLARSTNVQEPMECECSPLSLSPVRQNQTLFLRVANRDAGLYADSCLIACNGL
jgi:hypothetical protein